jgi:hypothetical protein
MGTAASRDQPEDELVSQRNNHMRQVCQELMQKHGCVSTSASLQMTDSGSRVIQLDNNTNNSCIGGDGGTGTGNSLSDSLDEDFLLLKVHDSLGEEDYYVVSSTELREQIEYDKPQVDAQGNMLYRITNRLMQSVAWTSSPNADAATPTADVGIAGIAAGMLDGSNR